MKIENRIPEGWNLTKLDDVIHSCKNGISLEQNSDKKGYKVTRIETISEGYIDMNKVGYVNTKKNIEEYKLDIGNILFSNINSVTHIGKTAYVDRDYSLYHGMNLLNIKADSKKIYSLYLYYLLNSKRLKTYFKNICKQAVNQASINQKDLKQTPLLIPKNKKEQKKIAQILLKIDKNIEKTEKIIEKYKKIKKSLMNDLLSGKMRIKNGKAYRETEFKEVKGIGKIPKDWDIKEIGKIAKVTMGQSPNSENYNTNGIGLYLIQGNADCKKRKTNPKVWTSEITKTCNVGDIIMTVRAPAGRVAKSYHKACIGRGVCSIKYKSNNLFLYYYLLNKEKHWDKLAQGTTFTAINSNDIKTFKISVPKHKEEQESIAKILSKQDELIEKEEQYLEKLKKLKSGLMEDLLTGKVRVKV